MPLRRHIYIPKSNLFPINISLYTSAIQHNDDIERIINNNEACLIANKRNHQV